MKYYMKQKVFSWKDRFSIYDETGKECCYVVGKAFSFGKKLTLFDSSGKELNYIRQELFSFRSRYEISRQNVPLAEVVKQITFFRPAYDIRGLDWEVQGDFFDHTYEITHGGALVARVSKQWFTLGDAYEIETAPGQDDALILSIVVVIDACLENR